MNIYKHIKNVLSPDIENSVVVIKDNMVFSFEKSKGTNVLKTKDAILIIEAGTNTIYFL